MKKHQASSTKKSSADAGNREEQRDQEQKQGAQLSAANVEESPHMDRRDSAHGAGESLGSAPTSKEAGESFPRGALDTQYGTRSSTKTASTAPTPSAGAGMPSGSGKPGGSDTPPQAPNPGSSEESSGAERDTMSGPRPGSRS